MLLTGLLENRAKLKGRQGKQQIYSNTSRRKIRDEKVIAPKRTDIGAGSVGCG
jgi:hypothetical protein